MSKIIRSACPLDCFDACGFLVKVEDGKVIEVKGDPEHPVTRGAICSKGRAHIERMYSQDRLKTPLLKRGEGFEEITWNDSIEIITDKIKHVMKKSGPQAIMHIFDCGYSGLSKSVDEMFFNHLGGVSVPSSVGSLCWKAGIVAQKIDFGSPKGHSADDLSGSKYMIIWGRNPAATNIHFARAIKAVQKNGGKVVCIDPFRTKTAAMADWHVQVKPGGDGALAFSVARILIEKGYVDQAFVENHTLGYKDYFEAVMAFDMSIAEERTGLPLEVIERLADEYGKAKPASIVLGYGMQRYVNGGNNIRAIDALGAITGNIGISGGGVTYANKSIAMYVEGYGPESESLALQSRTYKPAQAASFILNACDPEVEFLWIAKANPVVQVPNTDQMIEALKKTDFCVVVDMFMTDTAREADLVLPATSIFEESDFIYSSMYSPYLVYANKCVEAPDGMIGEYELFRMLAERLALEAYPNVERDVFFERAFKPLTQAFDLEYESLKTAPFAIDVEAVPWANRVFDTPSGKFEFVSESAAALGLEKTTCYDPGKLNEAGYPLRLITPHDASSMHSQHYRNHDGVPKVHVSPEEAQAQAIVSGDAVEVISRTGRLSCEAVVDSAILQGTVKIIEGTWRRVGAVNTLTEPLTCAFGDQAAYYDTFVKLSKTAFVKDAQKG